MRIRTVGWQAAVMTSALVSTTSFATDADETLPAVSFGGFVRADYGSGDRYPVDRGEDRAGVSKAALAATAEHEGIKAVLVVGTERLTDGGSDHDGDVDVKDAFIVIGAGRERGLSWSVGAQALLFGLKPNGYPGDRSLQPSIEFGGAGAFAVSNQAGPSLIGTYTAGPRINVRFGAFDLDADNATGFTPANSGSQLADNLFVQLRAVDLFGTGVYATLGAESLYVGGAVDDARPIVAAGVGLRHGRFDASVELTRLDRHIVTTVDDEQYFVTELGFDLNNQWMLYVDWAQAKELDADTFRVGAHYKLTRHLTVSSEYSKDDFGDAGSSDVDSIDLRVTFSY